ncbi:MAG TPA: ABC transporter permease, partial [Gemmatimonadaceae bacterium]
MGSVVTRSDSMPSWRRYLRFWGSDPRRDLDDELRFHLEARYEEFLAAGMDPARARAESEQRFGDLGRVRAQCEAIDSQWERERSMLDLIHTIGADFRYALRQLRRNAALNVAAILCFALGIGANTSIFSVVDAVLFRPLPFRDPERLVLVGESLPRFGAENFGVISAPEFEDYQRLNGRVFSNSAMYESESFAVGGASEPERVVGLSGSAALFDVFGVTMARGRSFASTDVVTGSPSVAVISDALWHRRFGGDPAVVGRSIDVDGHPTTIVGVARPEFRFPLPGIGGEPADVFLPYKMTSEIQRQRGNSYRTFLLARLAPGVTLTAAKRAVGDLANSLPVLHPESYGTNWKTVADAFPLRDQATKDVRRPLIILLSAVAMVLLIACINVSSLLIARAASRRREISVRQALGASRARLVQQFFAEAVVLVSIAGALGVGVATTGARVLAAHAPRAVLQGYNVSVDARVLAATAVVVVATALVFSLVPVLSQARSSLGPALHDEGRNSTAGQSRQRGRRVLVVTEISLALMLAAVAGLMVRSFLRARA